MYKASCILQYCVLVLLFGSLSAAQQAARLTPTVLAGMPIPVVGQQVTAEAVVSDPTFSALPSGSVVFDFGDGSPTTDVELANTLAVATHTYASLGTYEVTFTYSGDAKFTGVQRTMPLATVLQKPVLYLHTIGDSITGLPSSTWPTHLSNELNWNLLNLGLSDGTTVDLAHRLYAEIVNTSWASTYLLGENDVPYQTNSAGQAQYQQAVLASVAFLALEPEKGKFAANDANVTRNGVWSASGVFPTIGLVSLQASSTLQANLAGNVLYFGLTSLKTTDYTVEVLVDGVSKGTFSPVENYDGNYHPGAPYGIRLVLGGDLSAKHNVEVVCQTPGTSGCYVDWLGANGTSAPNRAPYVFLGTPYLVSAHPADVYLTMDGIVRQVASELAADGLPVWLADIAATFNGPLEPQCLLSDHVHPEGCGNDVIEANFLAATDFLTTEASPAISGSLSTTGIAFGNQIVGTESGYQPVTLTNTGGSPLTISSVVLTGTNKTQFLISSNYCPASLAAGANCIIHLHFYPLVTGPASAALTITDNATGSQQSVSLTGTGTTPAAVSLSTTGVAFGIVRAKTESVYQAVTLTNAGGSPLTINSVVLTGTNKTQFLISSNDCPASLAAGANCIIHLHFYPQVTGPASAALTITDNATGSPQAVSLTGTGFIPGTLSLSTTSVGFGTEAVNVESNYQVVTLTNTGTPAVAISSIVLTGANPTQFVTVNNCPATLAAGASCAIHPRFYPKVTGAASAALTITDNATGSPQSVSLTGTGFVPGTLSLSTTSVGFGTEAVNAESNYQVVTLTNTGTLPVAISSIVLTGANPTQFVTVNNCPASLAAGASCAIHPRFYPKVTGPASAALTITDNATGSPQSVSLTGTGSSE